MQWECDATQPSLQEKRHNVETSYWKHGYFWYLYQSIFDFWGWRCSSCFWRRWWETKLERSPKPTCKFFSPQGSFGLNGPYRKNQWISTNLFSHASLFRFIWCGQELFMDVLYSMFTIRRFWGVHTLTYFFCACKTTFICDPKKAEDFIGFMQSIVGKLRGVVRGTVKSHTPLGTPQQTMYKIILYEEKDVKRVYDCD